MALVDGVSQAEKSRQQVSFPLVNDPSTLKDGAGGKCVHRNGTVTFHIGLGQGAYITLSGTVTRK
ncbi:MAG: hypothetical protein ACYDBB_24675 [Armatimonadota bacterium]